MKKNTIELKHPKPLDQVGAKFIISGLVPISWLISEYGIRDNRIFLDLIDINGLTIMGSSIYVRSSEGWFSRFKRKLSFHEVFIFSSCNVGFLKSFRGRMTIKLSGHN